MLEGNRPLPPQGARYMCKGSAAFLKRGVTREGLVSRAVSMVE